MWCLHFRLGPTGCAIDLECSIFPDEPASPRSQASLPVKERERNCAVASEPPPVVDNAFFASLHCSAAPIGELWFMCCPVLSDAEVSPSALAEKRSTSSWWEEQMQIRGNWKGERKSASASLGSWLCVTCAFTLISASTVNVLRLLASFTWVGLFKR